MSIFELNCVTNNLMPFSLNRLLLVERQFLMQDLVV
jgi:hypothetical protein